MMIPRSISYQDKLHDLASEFYENPHHVLHDIKNYKSKPFRVGGMDLAKRVDHSAFICLKYDDGVLSQEAHMIWPHVKYGKVASDLIKIQDNYPMERIGFDRNSVGDFASELFDKTALPLEGIKTTMQSKLDMIHVIKTMFHQDILRIDTKSELLTQISEQESMISDAGNELYKHPPGRHDDLFWALAYACYVSLEFLTNNVTPSIRSASSNNSRGPQKIDEIDTWISHQMGGETNSILPFR